jgi:1,4-dihydroxy-2-naphthoyl-CoA hydrolase
MVFHAKNKVRMHDTDMAGRLYFARQFRFAHDALEDLVESEGLDFHKVFHEEKFVFVIVHCEADYFQQLRVGDQLDVRLSCEHIGQTSFILLYEIFRSDKELIGTVKTVHVALDSSTGAKIPLPSKLRSLLEKYKTTC